MRLRIGVVLLLAPLACYSVPKYPTPDELAADGYWQWFPYFQADFLCTWRNGESHPNPPELPFCESTELMPLRFVQMDTMAWFSDWSSVDATAGAEARKRFDAALRAAEAPFVAVFTRKREAEQRIEEERQQKARIAAAAAKKKRDAEFERLAPTMGEAKLCERYRRDGMLAARNELSRRKAFSHLDLAAIERRTVRIGMSESALLCSIGNPIEINRTVRASYVHKQYVYGGGVYVYVEDGFVTAFQD
jgi:hypothetical protein